MSGNRRGGDVLGQPVLQGVAGECDALLGLDPHQGAGRVGGRVLDLVGLVGHHQVCRLQQTGRQLLRIFQHPLLASDLLLLVDAPGPAAHEGVQACFQGRAVCASGGPPGGLLESLGVFFSGCESFQIGDGTGRGVRWGGVQGGGVVGVRGGGWGRER